MSKYKKHKLKAFGLLKAGKTPRDVSRDLSVPYSTVLRWNKQVDAMQVSEDLKVLVDTDKEIVHDIADKVQREYEALVTDADTLVGEIVDKVDGLQLLSTELTTASATLVKKLQAMAIVCTDTKDVANLVDAVAKLQTAFFSKGANVQVNVNNQASNKEVSKFKALERPA